MITLGGITLNSSLYLAGIESAALTSSTQYVSIGGVSRVAIKPLVGGRTFTLGTVNQNGALQGSWCQSVIDQIKELEQLASQVTLDYHGDTYQVLITSTASIEQYESRVPVSPTKKYIGSITLIEV